MGVHANRTEDRMIYLRELSFADYNPRTIPQDQMQALCASLKRFGQVEPLIVNRREDGSYVIVGGHQRARAMKTLGWEECHARVLVLNPTQERLLNLALNKVSSSWDVDAVETLLEELADEGEESLADLGFTDLDVEQALASEEVYSSGLIGESSPENQENNGETSGKPEGIVVKFGQVTARVDKGLYLDVIAAVESEPSPAEFLRQVIFEDMG